VASAALLPLLLAASLAVALVASPRVARADEETCVEDCWVLSSLAIHGAVGGPLTFELRGLVRSKHDEKIPLFGPPGQVRLDDVTLDGGRPHVSFDSDHYYLVTSARAFTLRGKLTLGTDQILSVPGPLLAVDAKLSKGRVVEGAKLSGLSNAVLHFDTSTAGDGDGDATTGSGSGSAGDARRGPRVFHLSRALRFSNETTFLYRLVASQGTDLGTVRLPLAYGEKVHEVQGSSGWRVEGAELVLPTSGKQAEITISGSLPPKRGPATFKDDERSAYEWWMIEADPEHRVATAGDAKLVETSQSPIAATMPGARVFLVQRGQQLEVDSKSLVRGDVLAAVARTQHKYVALTGGGELISDETIAYENNGLDHLMLDPSGKPMYLSTDASPQPILHVAAGARDVLVPLRPGPHVLRFQSLADVRLFPLAGAVKIPASSYPLATSASQITIGVPESIHPLAVLGGDRIRWGLSLADLVAPVLGIVFACFGFRTKKTRILGALATAGLWFVSREGFVVAAGALFVVGSIFLASRFLRGSKLLVASGLLVVVALFSGRFVLQSDAALEPEKEMFVERRDLVLPVPEVSHAALAPDGSLDTKSGVTPVSMSFPTSDRYVRASRQLVTAERPFTPRVVYVTSTLVAVLELAWLALAAALAWAHRERLAALKAKLTERLGRRPSAADGAIAGVAAPSLAALPLPEPVQPL
jgi:hypothetical protein